jgi:hypothetical protein
MHTFRLFLFLALASISLFAQESFLSTRQWAAIRDESSGAAPYENLRFLTSLHRVPATPEFDQAAQFMLQKAHEYGLSDAHSEQFPIDGTKTYGLMRGFAKSEQSSVDSVSSRLTPLTRLR